MLKMLFRLTRVTSTSPELFMKTAGRFYDTFSGLPRLYAAHSLRASRDMIRVFKEQNNGLGCGINQVLASLIHIVMLPIMIRSSNTAASTS